MSETYHKLVRDKIPDILDRKGVPYEKEIAEGEELRTWLIHKLKEEFDEFNNDESVEELADLLEVIKGLEMLPEYKHLESVRLTKKEDRGGFEQGIILKGEKG